MIAGNLIDGKLAERGAQTPRQLLFIRWRGKSEVECSNCILGQVDAVQNQILGSNGYPE